MTYSALARPATARPVIQSRKSSIVDASAINKAILIALIALLGLLYLTTVTKTDALGYKVHEFAVESARLQDEHNDLVIAAAQMQSLDRVENSDVASAMVPVIPQ